MHFFFEDDGNKHTPRDDSQQNTWGSNYERERKKYAKTQFIALGHNV